jgi:hypothetical protein
LGEYAVVTEGYGMVPGKGAFMGVTAMVASAATYMLGIKIRMAVHTAIRALAGTYMGGIVVIADEGERPHVCHTITLGGVGASVVSHG